MKSTETVLLILLILSIAVISCSSDEPKAKDTLREKGTNSSKPATNKTNKDDNNVSDDIKSGGFTANLPAGFSSPSDDVGRKLLKEYGGVFVAKGGAVPPTTVVFKNESEVSAFQSGVQTARENIGGFDVELQYPAMNALKEAISDAESIKPRGADSARRSYAETVSLWASRVEPGLKHWVGQGRLSETDASRIRLLSPYEQVPEIFKLEAQGMYFAKDLSKSIIYSVAPPGTSQHLSMLAFDVSEHENPKVRDILAKHGWFQTVVSDLPHFTFLGVRENELPALGLKKVTSGGRVFWVPDI